MKRFHIEAIPWPGSVLYNTISATGIFQRHYERIAADVHQRCPAGRLLDVGTGPGWLLVKLAQLSPEYQITGLDISPAMLDQARQNLQAAGLADVIDLKEGEAAHLPFPENTFEAVVSSGSLHHWKEACLGLNEIYRVLKPGGIGLIYDLVSDTPPDVIQQARRDFGGLKVFFLWLHAFEEPFYSHKVFHELANPSLFEHGESYFVGVMACLALRK